MNNDLISREALKKAFEDTVCIEPMPYAFVKQIIDNAPTVDTSEDNAIQYSKGYQDGFIEGKKLADRPKGEWITHQIGMLLWEECNQCHAQVGTVGMNFCPNCGADNRGDNDDRQSIQS